MKVTNEFNYRCALEILKSKYPAVLKEIYDLLNDSNFKLLDNPKGNNSYSRQIQNKFVESYDGWEIEASCFSANELRYDLRKGCVPVEIEIGHQRVVYADFFEFMADYANGIIDVAVMVVTDNPIQYGHKWHCSVESTKRKINSIKSIYSVPTLIIGLSRD